MGYLGSCKLHELSREQLFRMIRESFLIVKSRKLFFILNFQYRYLQISASDILCTGLLKIKPPLRVGSRPIFQDLLFLSTFPGICLSVFLFLSIFWLPKSPKNTTFSRFCLENTPKIFRLRRAFIFPHFLESEFFRIFYFYQLFPEFDSGFFIDGGLFLILR